MSVMCPKKLKITAQNIGSTKKATDKMFVWCFEHQMNNFKYLRKKCRLLKTLPEKLTPPFRELQMHWMLSITD